MLILELIKRLAVLVVLLCLTWLFFSVAYDFYPKATIFFAGIILLGIGLEFYMKYRGLSLEEDGLRSLFTRNKKTPEKKAM